MNRQMTEEERKAELYYCNWTLPKEIHDIMVESAKELFSAGFTKEFIAKKIGITSAQLTLFLSNYESLLLYRKENREGIDAIKNHIVERKVDLLLTSHYIKTGRLTELNRWCYLAGCPKITTGHCPEEAHCSSRFATIRRYALEGAASCEII